MAAYRRVYGFGHPRADCRRLGSAAEPHARFEYGTFMHVSIILVFVVRYACIQLEKPWFQRKSMWYSMRMTRYQCVSGSWPYSPALPAGTAQLG